jgi:hypothetical protein
VEQAGAGCSSCDEVASLVAGLIARVEALESENSALKRKLGTDSTNSSTPPSQDSLAAKGKRQAQRSGAGAVEGPEARWPAGTEGFGFGACCHAGSD